MAIFFAFSMIRFVRLISGFLARLFGAWPHRSSLPADWASALVFRKASAVRPLIKAHFAGDRTRAAPPGLFEAARQLGWPPDELDKLLAYLDFYGGNVAAGYQRVLAGRLAVADHPMLMTACTHCYTHDRYVEAYELLRHFDRQRAAEFDPLEFLGMAGAVSVSGGRLDEALVHFDEALDAGLVDPVLAINAYPVYFEAGRFDQLVRLAQIMRESYADDPGVIYALGWIELARGYYPEGFRLTEARYRLPDVERLLNRSLLSRPHWRGEPLNGRRLFVHGEQGYGDVAMMARYLPFLIAMDCKIIVDCREAAASLLVHNFPDCDVVVREPAKPPTADFDVWIGMMSLPFHFETTVDSVPATAGYLTAPPEQLTYWRDRVADHAPPGLPRIGVAWSGNPNHRYDNRRSLPFELIADHLNGHPAVPFFALQTTVPTTYPGNFIDVSEEMLTLADTAALIAEMDLVITVDTSIVHLAGALGKPTWLLLPYRYEWRWGLEGEGNPWYDSVRVLRQRIRGDWSGLLTQVFRERLPAFIDAMETRP